MGFLKDLADELGIEEDGLGRALKALVKPKKAKDAPEGHLFVKSYCEEFKKIYGTNPPIDGKTAGLAKSLVKDLGLAKCQGLMVTYLKMRRRDFVLKHHDLVTFKFNLNAITVQADVGRSVDHFDAKNIALEDHNRSAVTEYLKEKSCKKLSSDF